MSYLWFCKAVVSWLQTIFDDIENISLCHKLESEVSLGNVTREKHGTSWYRHWTGLDYKASDKKQNTLLKKRLLQDRLTILKENLKQSVAELGLSCSFFSQYDNNPKRIDEDFPTEDQSESYWLTCTKSWLQLHWKSVAWTEDKAPSQKAIKSEIAELFVKGDWAVRSLLKATANTCKINGYKND